LYKVLILYNERKRNINYMLMLYSKRGRERAEREREQRESRLTRDNKK